MGETSLFELKGIKRNLHKKSFEGLWENQDIETNLNGTPGVTFILR